VFTARYGLISYMKHITFRLLKVNYQHSCHTLVVTVVNEEVKYFVVVTVVNEEVKYFVHLQVFKYVCHKMKDHLVEAQRIRKREYKTEI
jgi:hypothetical protein